MRELAFLQAARYLQGKVHATEDMLVIALNHTMRHFQLEWSLRYVHSLDTITNKRPSLTEKLRKIAHGDAAATLKVPGFTKVSDSVAKKVDDLVRKEKGDVHYYLPGLSKLAGRMSADSLVGITLSDPVHDYELGGGGAGTSSRSKPWAVAFPAKRKAPSDKRWIMVMPGINSPNLIISEPGTCTAQHIEDMAAGACNNNLAGSPKQWCVLPWEESREYTKWLEEGQLTRQSRSKELIQGFDMYPPVEAGEAEIVLMQFCGLMVFTLAGRVWHQTTSAGSSIAEAVNNWLGVDDNSGAHILEAQEEFELAKTASLSHTPWARVIRQVGITCFSEASWVKRKR